MSEYIFIKDARIVGTYHYDGLPPIVHINGESVTYSGGKPAQSANDYRDKHHPNATVYIRVGQ